MEFPPTFVINLDSRPDKWAQIQKSFESWPVKLERISAVKASPGWKGCLRSHKKVLELCKARKLPFAIVLEDDCMLTPQGKENFISLLPTLQKRSNEWDIFLGGVTSVDKVKIKQYTPPLFELEGFTTHFCFVNSKSMDTITNTITEEFPIDKWYREKMRLWCTTPHIAIQTPGSSDIENTNTDYSDMFKTSQKALEESSQILEGFLTTAKQQNSKIFVADLLVLGTLICLWRLFTPAKR